MGRSKMNKFVSEVRNHLSDNESYVLYYGDMYGDIRKNFEFYKPWFRKNGLDIEHFTIRETDPDCGCDSSQNVYIFRHRVKSDLDAITCEVEDLPELRKINHSDTIISCDCETPPGKLIGLTKFLRDNLCSEDVD